MYAEKMADLRKLTDDELIKRYDAVSGNTITGTGFYLDELSRRQQSRLAEKMLLYTKWIAVLTVVVAICTIIVTIAALSD